MALKHLALSKVKVQQHWLSIVIAFLFTLIIVIPRFSVALLILAAAALSVSISLKKGPFEFGRPIELLLILIVVWTVASASMENDLGKEFLPLLKVSLLVCAGVFLLFSLSYSDVIFDGLHFDDRALIYGYLIGVLIVAGAASYAFLTGHSLWGSYYFDPLTTLNSNAVMLSLLMWPVVSLLLHRPPALVIGFLVLASALISVLSSGAALGALVVGGLIIPMRRLTGRRGGILIALVAAVLIAMAPYMVKVSGAEKYISPEVVNDSSSAMPYSTRHRLAMWAFVTEKIDMKPWLGWGFGASRNLPQEDHRLAPNMEIMPLHPHNLALQTRLELGLPGSFILAGLVFAVFYRLATFTDDGWKSGFAMAPAVGWLFIANVSYGMWQSWWIATAFLLVILMRLAIADPADKGPKTAEIPAS